MWEAEESYNNKLSEEDREEYVYMITSYNTWGTKRKTEMVKFDCYKTKNEVATRGIITE